MNTAKSYHSCCRYAWLDNQTRGLSLISNVFKCIFMYKCSFNSSQSVDLCRLVKADIQWQTPRNDLVGIANLAGSNTCRTFRIKAAGCTDSGAHSCADVDNQTQRGSKFIAYQGLVETVADHFLAWYRTSSCIVLESFGLWSKLSVLSFHYRFDRVWCVGAEYFGIPWVTSAVRGQDPFIANFRETLKQNRQENASSSVTCIHC